MTADEAIKSASDVVGKEKSDDYVLSPTTHAKEFAERAPALAAILTSLEISTTAEQYERDDEEAVAAQDKFKRTFDRANAAVLITGILIALVLATGTMATFLPEGVDRVVLVLFSLGSVVGGAIASKDLFQIKQGSLLEDWMTKRACAETTRLEYFSAVINASEQTPTTGIPLDLLKLEYFRRFQLDVQRAYYRERGRQHREKAAKILSLSSWGVAGAAIAAGSAGVLSVLDVHFAAVAALGTIFAGVSSFSSMREAVSQDRRNAERYGRTSRVLEDLYKRLGDVRKAVSAGETKALSDFVEAVHEQVSLEHRQWLGELSEAKGAFARLESTLKEALASAGDRKSQVAH